MNGLLALNKRCFAVERVVKKNSPGFAMFWRMWNFPSGPARATLRQGTFEKRRDRAFLFGIGLPERGD